MYPLRTRSNLLDQNPLLQGWVGVVVQAGEFSSSAY